MVTVRMSDFPKVHVCLIAFISDVLSGKDILHFFLNFVLVKRKGKRKEPKYFFFVYFYRMAVFSLFKEKPAFFNVCC